MQLTLPLPELADLSFGVAPSASHRLYCNRSLRLDQIEWVGFDMDYTLAIYDQREMDRLSIEATLDKLALRGYPSSLRQATYRTSFPIRGLLVDRKLGNVLKMDRYKYVKRAYHGLTELTKEERRHAYHTRRLRVDTARYHWVDTLYALSEVAVYAAAVDHLEQLGLEVDYDGLFGDVRECIDLSHQDGSILDHILGDLPRYVQRDPLLPRTLHHLRSAGKKLFLLTNSHGPYSDRMMSFLLDGGLPQYRSWRGYFDLVVCASRKPRFFTGDAEFEELLADGARRPLAEGVPHPERGRIYLGGNIDRLQAALGTTPDRVLYVGDHIYGDVLRAKKETAWRTIMVIQEMSEELVAHADVEHSLARLDVLEEQRLRLLEELREHQVVLKALERRKAGKNALSAAEEAERVRHRHSVDRLKQRIRLAERELDALERGIDRRFHRDWGSLFKAGPEVSSFGHQVEAYACLYTSRVSNLVRYSPVHYFTSPRDRMPHELR